MDEDGSNSVRRMSTRLRKIAPKMAAALANSDNRTQAILARLDALENDNAAIETAQQIDDEDEASLDDDDQVYQKKQSKSTKRKTRQAIALAKRASRTFLELLHEENLESLPPHVPTYLRAAVGPPSSSSSRHFCSVCGFTATYTCVQCGMRFCSIRCQTIHNDTRCLNMHQSRCSKTGLFRQKHLKLKTKQRHKPGHIEDRKRPSFENLSSTDALKKLVCFAVFKRNCLACTGIELIGDVNSHNLTRYSARRKKKKER